MYSPYVFVFDDDTKKAACCHTSAKLSNIQSVVKDECLTIQPAAVCEEIVAHKDRKSLQHESRSDCVTHVASSAISVPTMPAPQQRTTQ